MCFIEAPIENEGQVAATWENQPSTPEDGRGYLAAAGELSRALQPLLTK